MLDSISLDSLTNVIGGAGNSVADKWAEIRNSARPHCPNTVNANPNPPANREAAQRVGAACIAEMGSFKAGLGGRSRIEAGINEAFPAH